MQKKQQNNNKPDKEHLKAYAKYSGLAFQMLAIILLGVFGGRAADAWLQLSFPAFTVVGVILSVVAAIYYAVKDLLKK